MALPPLADILALFPDNTNGDISAADQRQMITDLYNQIALNDTDNNARVRIAGDTMTGPLVVDDNISITTANFLNFVAGQAVLASINTDIASNLTIRAVNNLTLDEQRLFLEQFNEAANLNKVLSITTNGEVVAVEDFARTILDGLNVVATTLPAGSTATASYDSATNTLTLGLPQGEQGEQGDPGTPGSGGFDPTSNQNITGQWAFDLGTMRTFRVFDDEGVDRININASTNQTLITNSTRVLLALNDTLNSRPNIRLEGAFAHVDGTRVSIDATEIIIMDSLGIRIRSGNNDVAELTADLTAAGLAPDKGWIAGTNVEGLIYYDGSQWVPLFPSHDAAYRQILRRMFESVADRDAYFGLEANFTQLLNGDLIATLNTDTNAVNFQTYQGASNPTVYLPNLWLNRSVAVPAGSVFLEDVRISLGGNALVITNQTQDRRFLAQGIEFTDSGSVATNNIPVLGALIQEANSQLIDTDTFTGQLLEFTLPAATSFLVSDFTLRFSSNVSDVTLTIFAGTDATGPQIVSTNFDAVPGDNLLMHDSNPRFVAGADYFIRYETTSANLNILGDNSGPQFIPYAVVRVWPYSETTAITAANIDSFVPTRADADAIHDNVANEINGIDEKTVLVDADLLLIEDSEDSFNKKKVQIDNLPGGTGAISAANVTLDTSDFTGVIVSSGNVRTAFRRIDATGVGAPIFRFTGSYEATAQNIDEWFDNRAQVRVEGIGSGTGTGDGVFTYDLPGSTVLGTVFDALVALSLPEIFTLVVDYTGGTSDLFATNRLVIRPRITPSPQIIGQTNVSLRRGQTATFRIERNAGVISDFTLVSLGVVSGTGGGSLNDFEFQDPSQITWDASPTGVLPSGGAVARGFAFLVVNAPADGSGRFDEVMQNGDWVVWTGETFTSWDAQPHQWIVVASHDVRRITQLEDDFLGHVEITPLSNRNETIRGSQLADTAAEIRIKIYNSASDYSPSDLNLTGDVDEFMDASDANGRIAIRLPGTLAANQAALPNLWIYAERSGQFTRVFNLDRDFTHLGDFATESDYLADNVYAYTANDVLRIYQTTPIDRYTIDNLDVSETNLTNDVQRKLNSPDHGSYQLPPALAALNNQASVFEINHSDFRVNNANAYLPNTFAFLKNAPTSFPPTAGVFANEIVGSVATPDDPVDLSRIQDVSDATNNVMLGAGINGNSFGLNFQDQNNWHLVIGGWMYYETLPTSFTPILRMKERTSSSMNPVYRDIFGIDMNGIQFRARATTGTTTNIGVRHPLYSTNGLLLESITAMALTRDWRIYTAKTYFIQVQGFNGGVFTGGEGLDYVVTDIDIDQTPTTLSFDVGLVADQDLEISFTSNDTLYGPSAHVITVEATSLNMGIDELRIDILDTSSTVTASAGNTYNSETLNQGHLAAGRLMRYIASFRSVGGVETGDLECVITFFGYDDNGNPQVFDENTFELLYPALDLDWNDGIYGGDGIHQNIQGFFLNPDTPLLEFPRHSTLRDWLTNYDDKTTRYVWGNVDGQNQDIEVVNFQEFVNFSNIIFVSPNGSRFRLDIDDAGTLDTKTVA